MIGNPRGSGYDRERLDSYREPAWALEALLDVEPFSGPILDPAGGSGTIPRVCRDHGLTAFGSDIVNRGFGMRTDFFDRRDAAAVNIVSNPPFRIIERFIQHALTLASDKVAILARLALLERSLRSR
jgi:hypothetical protein